jgi:hypothetical protein
LSVLSWNLVVHHPRKHFSWVFWKSSIASRSQPLCFLAHESVLKPRKSKRWTAPAQFKALSKLISKWSTSWQPNELPRERVHVWKLDFQINDHTPSKLSMWTSRNLNNKKVSIKKIKSECSPPLWTNFKKS